MRTLTASILGLFIGLYLFPTALTGAHRMAANALTFLMHSPKLAFIIFLCIAVVFAVYEWRRRA